MNISVSPLRPTCFYKLSFVITALLLSFSALSATSTTYSYVYASCNDPYYGGITITKGTTCSYSGKTMTCSNWINYNGLPGGSCGGIWSPGTTNTATDTVNLGNATASDIGFTSNCGDAFPYTNPASYVALTTDMGSLCYRWYQGSSYALSVGTNMANADGDRVPTAADNCPTVSNTSQADTDGDGVGDACDSDFHDNDGDGVDNIIDNCPSLSNPDQWDNDSDAQGDACDADDDNDGVSDVVDSFPFDPSRSSGNTNILYTFNGDNANDQFGTSVNLAGDVNQDGYPDVIIGAIFDDNNVTNSGSARVCSGKDGSILYTFNGDGTDDYFGNSVNSAGDVNNDGYDDVIVGADHDDNKGTDSGSARVLSGKDGAILYTFNGDSAGDLFGGSVSAAGDVNKDGFDDVVVGAKKDDNNGTDSGSARILSGKDGAILYTFNGDSAGDTLGWSVSAAGDVNKDGYPDVIVGANQDDNNGAESGSARIYSGINGSILYTFNGDVSGDPRGSLYGDGLGTSVSGAGDVNGDGYVDVIVGAPYDDNNGTDSGSARVFSGINGSILYTFYGDSSNDWFGSSVSAAGDVNGDGYADVIVSTWLDDNNGTNSGSARVFSGADGSILYTFNGDSTGDDFGYSIGAAGDVNKDGYDDVIIGAVADDNNGATSGSARVFSGRGLWVDADGDGQNDAIDTDDDNDGVLDINDLTPRGNDIDTDNDGTIDAFDIDDDNDGVADTADRYPLDATRYQNPRHSTDIDNDSDVLVRTTSSGAWTRYSVQNGAIVSNGSLNIPVSSDTQYVAQLDANGDGDADVLTRSASTGAWTLYQIQNGAVAASGPIYLYANLGYQFVGAGDFNNDGTDDVLLRDATQGYRVFLLQNNAVSSVVYFNAWTAASSVDQGIGDFDGDGTDDVLVRRTSDNLYFVFKTINGAVNSYYCACNIWNNPDWTFQFAGDTNKDGIDDIVIRGTGASADGKWWAFRMNNFISTYTTNLNLFINKTAVTFGAVGDYNGDGTIDVLTRVNNSTTYVSPLNNGLVTGNNWLYGFTTDQVIGK